MKFAIISLGCRLNMAEIQSVSSSLIDAGHEATDKSDAKLLIINSCGVTVGSERKTRQLLYQSIRSGADKIILTGCASGNERQEDNVYYLSNDHKNLIPKLVEDWTLFESIIQTNGSRFDYKPAVHSSRARINIKIQDGCDHFCSYCIIPILRGAPESRDVPSILDEIQKLCDLGYHEFLLSGVCVGNYLHDSVSLGSLLEKVLELPGSFRIHISSISPWTITDQIIAIFQHEKMVKHMSLSLQSGSNSVLKEMNRLYTASDYLKIIDSVKKNIPLFNFTTDVIVGFPGETDKDFAETLAVVKEAGISHVHTFRYSPRPGTKAFEMSETVPETVKVRRSRMLNELCAEQKRKYYELFNGVTSVFLNEGTRNGVSRGFNEFYVPVKVEHDLLENHFFKVHTEFSPIEVFLRGKVISSF